MGVTPAASFNTGYRGAEQAAVSTISPRPRMSQVTAGSPRFKRATVKSERGVSRIGARVSPPRNQRHIWLTLTARMRR